MYINPRDLLKALTLFPPWLTTKWTPQDDSNQYEKGLSHSTLSAIAGSAGAANFSGSVVFAPKFNAAYASVNYAPAVPYDWRGYECGGLEVDVKGRLSPALPLQVLTLPSAKGQQKEVWRAAVEPRAESHRQVEQGHV